MLEDEEEDPDVPSDLPYACEAAFSRRPQDFLGPTRVVGRLPDLTGRRTVLSPESARHGRQVRLSRSERLFHAVRADGKGYGGDPPGNRRSSCCGVDPPQTSSSTSTGRRRSRTPVGPDAEDYRGCRLANATPEPDFKWRSSQTRASRLRIRPGRRSDCDAEREHYGCQTLTSGSEDAERRVGRPPSLAN
jgi:hypothetical protein